MYPMAYLELQMVFAQRMAELTGVPYYESLLRNTDLYGIFGLKWDEDLPIWQQYMSLVPAGSLGINEAYRFYSQRYARGLISDNAAGRLLWGCFSYDYDVETKGVHVHFADRDTSGFGPLSHQRLEERLAELLGMFTYIRRERPDAKRVIGAGTWLLNRIEYRRLFPPEQVQYSWVGEPLLYGTGLWGQFLRRGPRMDEAAAAFFLDRVSRLCDAGDVAGCFPLQAIRTDGPISNFYGYYGIGDHCG